MLDADALLPLVHTPIAGCPSSPKPKCTQRLNTTANGQVPEADKQRRADYVIDTGCDVSATALQVTALAETLKQSGWDAAYCRATGQGAGAGPDPADRDSRRAGHLGGL
jgi:hypothetical protein